MQCNVCGLEYGMSHNCPGPITSTGGPSAIPENVGLGYYLEKAWKIIRWDDAAIREVMDDRRALPYGLLIWTVSNTLPMLVLLGLVQFAKPIVSGPRLLIFFGLLLVYGAAYSLVHIGICHLIAKYFCAGDGKFMQILRPLLLASLVYILLAIPLAGTLVAGIAWVAVMMMVFQEVHGMEPLTAFLISAAVGVALRVGAHYLLHFPLM
jgi:hypothetical protein